MNQTAGVSNSVRCPGKGHKVRDPGGGLGGTRRTRRGSRLGSPLAELEPELPIPPHAVSVTPTAEVRGLCGEVRFAWGAGGLREGRGSCPPPAFGEEVGGE